MRTTWGAAVVLCLSPALAVAGGKITIGDNQSVSVGGGLRTSLNFEEDGAPNGTDLSKDFRLNSVRLYLGGQVAKGISATFNTEYDGSNGEAVRVLDALAQFAFSDGFNIWAGRFLPPSDRANLDGPYYMPVWDYPFVSNFPAVFAGRDDGLAAWGQFQGGKVKYQVGAFQGTGFGPTESTTPNQKDSPLFAGRFTVNLRDPEPGYYTSSTYWGAKKIFAIAVTAQQQSNASGTASAPTDFTGIEADVLFEQPMSGGTFTAEGAFYNFDWGSELNPAQGSSFYVTAGYLLASKVGPGQFQPIARFQSHDSDATGFDVKKLDAGLNYVVAGDNARFHAQYSHVSGDAKGNAFTLGAQLQF
jgi:hypothetical protein